MTRAPTLAPLVLLLTACSRDVSHTPDHPQLPALALRPFQPELSAIAASLPTVPDATRAELRDLADIALHVVEADSRTAARAERALLDNPACWCVLEPALEDKDRKDVRARAAWLCGRSEQSMLQLPLLLRLKYELDPDTILWVADALQHLGNDAGLPFLDGAMGVEATAQRAGEFTMAICRERGLTLAEQPTYDELRQRLRDLGAAWRQRGTNGRPGLRPPAAEQLDARLGKHLSTTQGTQLRPVDDARFVLVRSGVLALPLLTKALGAAEPYLRTMALQVLAELGAPALPTATTVLPLLADPLTASDAVRTLGEIGAVDALPHLRARLSAIDTEMRAAVPLALGLLGDRTAGATLTQRMQDQKEALDVRVNAAFGLLALGPDTGAEAFIAEREQKGDFHAPMLARLRERIARIAH